MESSSLISVIIPVYKVEKYLSKCIESIINQTWRNLQIVLVDDGSPDACPKICDYYAARDSRIEVIHQKNAGVSAARNAGLRRGKGDWISFIDSDDCIALTTYQKLMENVQSESPDCVMYDWSIVDDLGNIVTPKKEKQITDVMNHKQALELYFDVPSQIRRGVTTKLFRADIVKSNNMYFDQTIHASEDCIFLVDYLLKCKKVTFVNEELYINCVHAGSAMNGGLCAEELAKSLYVQKSIVMKVINKYPEIKNHANYFYADYCVMMMKNCSRDSLSVKQMKKVYHREFWNILTNKEMSIKQRYGYLRSGIVG